MRVFSRFPLALLLGGGPLSADILYSVTDLGTFGGATLAYSLNNAGQITGTSYYPAPHDPYYVAFLYSDGQMTNLGTLGAPQGTISASVGYGINDAGQVTGRSDAGTLAAGS